MRKSTICIFKKQRIKMQRYHFNFTNKRLTCRSTIYTFIFYDCTRETKIGIVTRINVEWRAKTDVEH